MDTPARSCISVVTKFSCMRHLKRWRKLGRTSSHYRALGQSLVNHLFTSERIITTREKAKEFTSLAERLITRAKDFNLHNYRYVLAALQNKITTRKLFKEIAPRFKDRAGGYTRIIKLGGNRWSGDKNAGKWAMRRLGDNGHRVIWELVVRAEPAPKKTKAKEKT